MTRLIRYAFCDKFIILSFRVLKQMFKGDIINTETRLSIFDIIYILDKITNNLAVLPA